MDLSLSRGVKKRQRGPALIAIFIKITPSRLEMKKEKEITHHST